MHRLMHFPQTRAHSLCNSLGGVELQQIKNGNLIGRRLFIHDQRDT